MRSLFLWGYVQKIILEISNIYLRLFFSHALRGAGPTLRPVSPAGWPPARRVTILRLGEKRGLRLDLEQKSTFMDGHELYIEKIKKIC